MRSEIWSCAVSPHPQRAQERQPRTVRQSKVEQYQTIENRLRRGRGIGSARKPVDGVAGRRDMVAQRLPQNLIVFD